MATGHDALDALSDGALMVLFAGGDPQAAHILTERLLPRALSHATRVLGNAADAEDVAQEAMLRLWKAASDWDQNGPAAPATWLHRVVANLCIDRMRRRGPETAELEPDSAPDPAPSAVAQIEEKDRFAALDAALTTLPERQRQAVVLRHIEGYTNPEIAEILGVGVEAVESLTARGKRTLKRAFEGLKERLGYEE